MTTPPTKEEARSELHAAIMNLRGLESSPAYVRGHRDARHAAAELVAAAPLSPAGQAVRMLTEEEESREYMGWNLPGTDAALAFHKLAPNMQVRQAFIDGLRRGLSVGQPAGLEVSDEQIEAAAEIIYETWADDEGYVAWVAGGNSINQDVARRAARAVSAVLAAGLPVQAGDGKGPQ